MLELSSYRSGLFCFGQRRSRVKSELYDSSTGVSDRHEWNMKEGSLPGVCMEMHALGHDLAEELCANPGMAVTKVANIICRYSAGI